MAFGDPYMSTSEFNAQSGATETPSGLTSVLVSASRQIDGYCSQRFDQSGDVMTPVVKYLTSMSYQCLSIPPLVSVSELAVDLNGNRDYTQIWSTTDYDLLPYEAADLDEPYREIATTPLGRYAFPTFGRGIKLTGIWGWPEVPETIKQVCYLIANRNKSLWNAPFGSTGSGELGAGLNMTQALTPLIQKMLDPYRAMYVVGAV